MSMIQLKHMKKYYANMLELLDIMMLRNFAILRTWQKGTHSGCRITATRGPDRTKEFMF